MSAERTLTGHESGPPWCSRTTGRCRARSVEASDAGVPAGDWGSGDEEVDEWFVRAAAGGASDAGDTPGRELLGAAALPLHAALVRAPRPRRALMGVSSVTRCWRAPSRTLVLATFALLIVVVVVMGPVVSPSSTATEPVIVTDASASIHGLGDAVDRRMKVAIARHERAGGRRRAAAQTGRRRANERRQRSKRGLLAAGRRAAARARSTTSAPVSRVAVSALARRVPAATRRRPSVPRRSTCGPFDLC